MRKRPMVHLALAFLLGALCVHHSVFIFLGIVFLIADSVVLHTLHWNKISIHLFVFALLLSFVGGAIRTGWVNSRMDEVQKYVEKQDELVFEGKLYKKEVKNERTIYYLKNVLTTERKIGRIVYYPNEDNAVIGAWMYAKGTVLAMHIAENEGGFDEAAYYRSLGIAAKVAEEESYRTDEPMVSAGEWLYRLRERMRLVYKRSLYGEEAGLLAMMAIGSRTAVDADAKELFSEAGLSHIFAISGLHISIVGMGIFALLRRRKCSILVSAAVGGVIVVLYAQMVGASVSTVRAVGMFIVLLLANVFGQAYDSLSALAAMAVVILVANPLAVGQASFVFSFGAVAGLVLVASPVAKIYEKCCEWRWEQTHQKGKGRRWHIRIHERILSALIWGAALQVATIPLVAYYFYSVPTYVLFLNLVLLPCMGILLGLGLVGGLIGCVLPQVGMVLLFPCHFLLYYYEWMAAMSLELPCSRWIVGKPALWKMAVYYIVIYFLCYRLNRWKERVQEEHRQTMERVSGRRTHQRLRFGGRKRAVQTVLVCGALLLFLQGWARQFEVVMLSVGQGDGIFVDSGMGERYFIDGGSTSQEELGKYTLLPFLKCRGIGWIDAWFLTHTDLDHISGFLELVESGYRVERLVLAESIEKTEKYEEIVQLCRKYNVNINYMKPKDRIICAGGLLRKRNLAWECVAPDVPPQFSGPNENSLVLHLRYWEGGRDTAAVLRGNENGKGKEKGKGRGNNAAELPENDKVFDGIFTGDIGEEQERAILVGECGKSLSELGERQEIELLKSAHHGSNGSNCTEWLAALQPQLTIISAGENNRYGHPGKEAIARMDELGVEHICTIDCGEILVKWVDGEMKVNSFFNDIEF